MYSLLRAVANDELRSLVLTGDGLTVLRTLQAILPPKQRVHIITDPPYSDEVHRRVQTGKRNHLPDVDDSKCRERRVVDLGFKPMTQPERVAFAGLSSAVATGWSVIFSDAESTHLWRDAFNHRGLARYFRIGCWVRLGGAPHFNGDGPAPGHEELIFFHAGGHRRRWNGGGKAALYQHAVVANRKGQQGSRVYTAQKPVPLLLELVADMTEPGDLVVDPYCGVGTTGVACARLGRRFIGIEEIPWVADLARENIAAERDGSTLRHRMRGQLPLFGAASSAT